MNAREKYIRGLQLRALGNAEIEAASKRRLAAREKERRESEEIKRRAAESVKNWENAKAEVEEKSSWPQPSLFVPNQSESPVVKNTTANTGDVKKATKTKPKLKHEAEKYYPTSLYDTVIPSVGFNTKMVKPSWGTSTVGEQVYMNQQTKILGEYIKNTPLMLRNQEDQDYYNSLKQAYINEANKEINRNFGFNSGQSSLASKPASNGLSRLFNNNLGLWGKNKNETEITSYAGDILKNEELRGYVQQLRDYQNMLDELSSARKRLIELNTSKDKGNVVDQDLHNRVTTDLQNYVNNLVKQADKMKKAANVAVTYLDSAVLDKAPDRDIPIYMKIAQLGMGEYRQTPVLYENGKYSPVILNLIDKLATEYKDPKTTEEQKANTANILKNILDEKVKRFDAEDEISREGMRQNIQELEKWNKDHPIDKDFLKKSEAASQDLNFLDPDTYLYGLSGVLGSSAAFNGLSWANTALSTIGGLMSTTGVGLAPGIAVTALGSSLGLLSGARENASEIYENVSTVFSDLLTKSGKMDKFLKSAKEQLGKDVTYEQAFLAVALGQINPTEDVKKLLTNSTFGANNLFKHDMFAVTADNLLETTINFVPFGKIAQATIIKPLISGEKKIAKLRRLAQFKAGIKNLNETAYNLGATINPVVGVGTAALGALTRPLRKPVADFVSKHTSEALMKKFGTIAEWAKKAPKKLLNAKVVGRSAKDWLGRTLTTSWAEAIEEGKQYYNGKLFAAGNYAGESDSWWDVLLGDIEGGSKSALQFVGSFLGLGTDREWITNMRGGFLAGGGHTAIVSGVGNVRGAVAQIKANNVVVNNILATKLEERARLAKGQSYANRSSFADHQAMNKAFDDMKALQHRLAEEGKESFSDELIEDQRQMYNRVFNIANSSVIKSAARERGIEIGSNRYNTLVSLVDFARQEGKEALTNLQQKLGGINDIISKTLWGDDLSNIDDIKLHELIENTGISVHAPSVAEYGPQRMGEWLLASRLANETALSKVSNLVDYIAHLDALMSYRDQIELKDVKTAADKRKLRSINKQLDELRNSVRTKNVETDEEGKEKVTYTDNELSNITTAQLLQKYVWDTELHDVIRDQYRDVVNFAIDQDNANAMLVSLIGERAAGNLSLTDELTGNILGNVGELLSEYNKVAKAVADNKDVEITESGLRHGELNPAAAKKANKVIDDYLKAVKDDEDFEQEIHDDIENAISELYGNEIGTNEVTEETSDEVAVNEEEIETTPSSIELPEKQEEEPTKIPLLDELSDITLPRVAVEDIYDYIQELPLILLSEDELNRLNQDAKDMIKNVYKMIDDWIKMFGDAIDENGTMDSGIHDAMILQWEYICTQCRIANTTIEAQLILNSGEDSNPVVSKPDPITEEQVVESQLTEELVYLDNVRAAIEHALNELQSFLQTFDGTQDLTQEGVADILQHIANLDALIDTQDAIDAFGTAYDSYKDWYLDNRGWVLQYARVSEELKPEPNIPTPPIGATQFDTSFLDDPDNWSLLTNTTWSNPAYGTGTIATSVATDDFNIRLVDVIGSHDFMNEATFELQLLTLPNMRNGNQPFVIIHYKGHTFTPVFIQTAANQNRGKGAAFWNAIRMAQARKGDGQIIIPLKVSRTLGKERRTDSNGALAQSRSLFDVGLITEDNMYELEFSVDQDVFGVTEETKDAEGTPHIIVYTPSADGKGHQPIYPYSNSNHSEKPAPGVPVMLIDRHYDELGGRKARVPVNMMFTKLTLDDATLIADILKGKHCADRDKYGVYILQEEYVLMDERGNLVGYGITNGDVLNFLMKYGYRYPDDRKHVHLEYNEQDGRRVSIVGFVEGQSTFDPSKPNEIPSREYNLFDENEYNAFCNAIAGVINRNFDSQRVAPARVGEKYAAADSTNPFKLLNLKLQSSKTLLDILNTKGRIQFGNSAIVFDLKDFAQQGNPDSEGVSGMVWYTRHGFLQTRFNGFENTILVFDEDAGVKVVDGNPTSAQTIQEQNEQLADKAEEAPVAQTKVSAAEVDISEKDLTRRERKDRINEVDDDELAKMESALPSDKERINLDEAKQHLLDILGDCGFDIKDEFADNDVQDMLNMFKNGPVALGGVRKTFINLSKYARRGTEYHEAFHIVVEMLLSPKDRDKVYRAYAKAKHIKLYNNDGSLNIAASKLVTEGLADEFMMYSIDRPTVKLTWNLRQLWHSIKSWAQFYNTVGSWRLYKIYRDVNHGKFKDMKPTKEARERFVKLLSDYKQEFLPFSVNGQALEHVSSVRAYKNLCNTMVYILFQSQKNIDKAGRNMLDFKLDNAKEISEYKLFKKYAAIHPGLQDLLDHWEIVKPDIRTLVSQISTPYIGTNDNAENVEDMQGDEESVANAGIGDYTRDSQEFSQFSRASEKVKFFFSIIPNVEFKYNNLGKKTTVSINNAEGLPQFVKPSTMYNTVLNQVYNCRTLDQLIRKLETLGKENAKFDIICKRIKDIKKHADEGNVEDATLLTQMMVNLHASKGEYVICKASKDKTGFNLTILSTDTDYEAKNYRREWSLLFAGGAGKYIQQNADGTYETKGNFKPSVFTTLSQFLIDFADAVSPMLKLLKVAVLNEDNKLQYRTLDLNNSEDLALAKAKFISLLNGLGIQFSTDIFNYMLSTKYGSTDRESINKFFSETQIKSANGRQINVNVRTFASYIAGFNLNGKLNIQKTDNGYIINGQNIRSVFSGNGSGFIGVLATWAYNYKKSLDQLSILANKQNRQYLISENNYLTDTLDEMNASLEGDTQKIDDLKSFVYNWPKDSEDSSCTTIILGNYSSKNPKKLLFVTNSGFKTDSKNDIGEDYAEISEAQDEVSKIKMLLDGNIILPTLSDKKTWGYIRGVKLPGLDCELPFTGLFLNSVTINPNGSYTFSLNRQVLDLLRHYAILEHRAVLLTLKDVKGYTDEGGTYHAPLKESEKVNNYHKATVKVNGKEYNVIQGARYSSMYCMFDGKGRKIHFNRVCDENGNFISEEKNIEMAMSHFFGVPSLNPGMFWIYNNDNLYVEVTTDQLADLQRQIIARSLLKQLRKLLDKAERIGLISRVENADSVPYIYSFENKLLDLNTIRELKKALPLDLTESQKESLAIAIMMNDVSCKSIMSLQETERIFSGHPAFYKWQYNSKGYLSDRSTDQHKRFGGLVSTGQNNAYVFEGLPQTYKIAEINDVEIGSPNIEYIEKMMYEGELRATYLRKLLLEAGITIELGNTDKAKELANKADSEAVEAIETALLGVVLDTVKTRATAKINAFRKKINVADGATYITDDMCENLLKQVGSYGEDIQRAFKVLRGEEVNGRRYTPNDTREMLTAYNLIYTTVIGTLKYTAYGFRKQNGVLVPYYNKTALFPLFKALATGNTAKLYAKMKKQGVDMVAFNSAVKVGSQGSQDIDFDIIESDGFNFNVYEQEYKYLRKQFNTDPKEKEMMAMGTQMTKIIMSAMLAGRDYIITNPDGSKRTVNVKDLRDEIMTCINKLAEKGFDSLHDRLFDGDRLNVREFSKFLTEELSSRGASRELLRAVSIVDENTTDIDPSRRERIKETGRPELRVPMVALSSINWIQSVINAKVNKSIIDINTPGAAFIQRSVFGMEGTTKSDILTQDELVSDIYEGRELQFRNENGSMDCVLSIDFFANIIPENLSFEEAKQWLIDNKVISGRLKDGTWSDADASIIGYRIPTQAQSSIHALRCVDVLPVVRDTVVLPKEFTKITGSDFDIDKLFLSTVHYNIKDTKDSSGNILSRSISKEFKEDSEQYYANKLILDYISLLKDSKSETDTSTRSMLIGDASIDNDTKLLTDIVEDLEGSIEEDLDPYDTYSLWRNTSIRDQYITGKFGIGPFALNNNSHILTMLYGVKFAHNPSSILGITGHESLYDAEDMYGESIMSWLSGLINAHVDVAKDPYISKLNVNKYTYNLVNLMIRIGFGRMTFYFMTQPMMRELAQRVNNAASAYGGDSNKSKFRRQKEAEENFIIEYMNKYFKEGDEYKSLGQALSAFTNHLRRLGTSKSVLFEAMFNPKSEFLHEISKSKEGIDSLKSFNIETKNGTVHLTMLEALMLVYLAKDAFNDYSDGISQFVKYCKIDTKKQGKNISEQRDFERGYNRLFKNSRSKLYKLFDGESLLNLRWGSYIETKTTKALKMFSDILSDQLLDATRSFNNTTEFVLAELPVDDENISEKLAKKVSDTILVSVRSNFFNNYAEKIGTDIVGLVSGDNTIYDRLNKIKISIQTNDRYAELKNPDGSIDNYLLNMLTSGYTHKQTIANELTPKAFPDTYGDAKFISSMTFMSDDSVDADEVSEAWEELLEDSRFPELQQFARDLIIYSFITTGGNGGSNNIFKYIPMSWMVNPDGRGYEASYAFYMQEKLDSFRRLNGGLMVDIDEVILNNWTDELFIPTVKLQDVGTFYTGRTSYEILNGKQVNPNTDIPIIIQTSLGGPRFIKIRRQYDPESQRSVAIYKRVRENSTGSIYVLVEPKGQNFGGKNKIYEFGRVDAKLTEVTRQLGLNKKLAMFAEAVGADMNSTESVLTSLISFIESKENKAGALELLKNYGVSDALYDILYDIANPDKDLLELLDELEENNNTLSEKEQKKIDDIKHELEKIANDYKGVKSTKGFITDLSSAFGIKKENASEYVSIVAQNGMEFTIRISNHNANAETFEENSELDNNISITIKSKMSKNNFHKSQNVNLTEFVYFKEDVLSSDTNVLLQIAEALIDTLNTGFYVDKTGIAKVNTSNRIPNSYSGNITPQDNVVFVFGSNPEGRHGAGSAKIAHDQFGAQYGIGEGLTGNSYALPTKDLRVKENNGFRSIPSSSIIESIRKLYETARLNPDKIFRVAYRNGLTKKSLNGYTGGEMIAMFLKAGQVPENVLFSEEWISNWETVELAIEQSNKCKGR